MQKLNKIAIESTGNILYKKKKIYRKEFHIVLCTWSSSS